SKGSVLPHACTVVEATVQKKPDQENPLGQTNWQEERVVEDAGGIPNEFVEPENPKSAIYDAGSNSDSGACQPEGPDAWFGYLAQAESLLEDYGCCGIANSFDCREI